MNPTRPNVRRRGLLVGTMTAVLGLLSFLVQSPEASEDSLVIRALSNRADLVSGGEVLVEVTQRRAVRVRDVRVDVDGRDVTTAFSLAREGRYIGLVTGLRNGANRVTARRPDGSGAILTVTNHPTSGPIFAGRQVQPWVCTNAANGLGAPLNAACDTNPVFTFFYKDAITGSFTEYNRDNPPAEARVAKTTMENGQNVPYIVRQERGVLDRGIYQIGVLYNPAKPWTATQPQSWARKVVITTGSACDAGHVMLAPKSVLVDAPLSRGWAVIGTEMMDNTQNCNDVVQAEAFMMLKEHFIDAYGDMLFALGSGCSGGSMAQHSVAANYPGLLDGIQPACSFPDMWTTLREMADCKLLAKYFTTTSPHLWPEPQRAAASGHATAVTCEFENTRANSYVSATGNSNTCGGQPWSYDAKTNRKGARCSLFDYAVAVWGSRKSDGFANRAWDNIGLQYGLKALQDGSILPEQFVDLNEKVGGLDIDGNPQAARTAADPAALPIAYRTGRLTSGRELAKIPIIDLRGSSNAEEHFDFHTLEMRARLDRDNGNHDNHISWNSSCTLLPCPPMEADAMGVMDQWLTAIKNDSSSLPAAAKVRKHKPKAAVDACYVPARTEDRGVCAAALPVFSDTRVVAGGPVTADVVKCQLKTRARADYPGVQFTDAQWARLQKPFSSGVCDFSKSGVAQQAPIGPWITFAKGPGGELLGGAPTSTPISARGTAPAGVVPVGTLAATGGIDTWACAALLSTLVAFGLRSISRRRPAAIDTD